jgi:D-cysteine desulfhydrase
MNSCSQNHPVRTSLGFLPTPVHALDRLSRVLNGPRILIKRDDLTGLASGGNKVRKLEFLLGDALKNGCDTVITGGAAQSNHCRQTAAAAAYCGLQCHLVLGGQPPECLDGNLLLDDLFGAEIHWTGPYRKGEKIPEIVERLAAMGRRPYVIPYGGSNAVGALGFVRAMQELEEQLLAMQENINAIVFASSSGGTQAGMIVGRSRLGRTYKLIGIGIDKGEAGDAPFDEHILQLARETAGLLDTEINISIRDITINNDFFGKGYGVIGELERNAIRLMAETEGVLLDPVYTGRALGGLTAMIKQGEFNVDDTVLFWHTGGMPALFSYAEELQR